MLKYLNTSVTGFERSVEVGEPMLIKSRGEDWSTNRRVEGGGGVAGLVTVLLPVDHTSAISDFCINWTKMGQIWDFLTSVSVHFGMPSQNVLKNDLKKSLIWG